MRMQRSSDERLIFYFLTADLRNIKERNEIEYLRSIGRVVLVSRQGVRERIAGVKCLSLAPLGSRMVMAYLLWTKLCYLLCRIAASSSDMEFPSRNVYSGNRLVRAVVNQLWKIKRLSWVNRWLPSYDRIYFAPFRLAAFLTGRKLRPRSRRARRVVVHESLLLRLTGLAGLIAIARRSGIQTIANVKSWDNPFYSQFASGADAYLVWSRSMWADVKATHGLPDRPVHVWGARPFFNFSHTLARAARAQPAGDGSFVIGYAAAFCDTLMLEHELAVLGKIATELRKRLPNAKILVRPYPILPLSEYAPLARHPNIELNEIQGEVTDRYNDGRELIRFGSDEERIQYLARCHCFLSMATSFTIEAAMFGLPVVHFYIRPEQCAAGSEFTFFQRIAISDHLLVYFNQELLMANDYATLVEQIAAACNEQSPAWRRAQASIRRIGIPEELSGWRRTAATLASDIQPGALN
jgi:hypothetical protein